MKDRGLLMEVYGGQYKNGCNMRWQDFSVPVTPVASAIQAADMDIVDVLHPAVRKGVLVGRSA